MEYTAIPGIGLEVSRVALGTWAIGGWMWGGTDEEESVRAVHAAIDRGINIIDTAPVYGFGRSEEIVGRAVAETGRRQSLILATKAGLEWSEDGRKIVRNSSGERLRQEVEDSLRRLRTDYIDLYQVHWPDPQVDYGETAEMLERFKEEGKIRAAGVSNYSPEQMDSFRRSGSLSSCQPPYNLFEREIEQDVKPYCKQNGIVLLTYGALCRGLLSGKMSPDSAFEGDDLRQVDPKFKQPRFGQYLEAAGRLEELARQRFDKSVLHLAVRWVLDQGAHIALWGARRPQQLAPLPEVFGWEISAGDMAAIDAVLSECITDPVGPEFMAPPGRG